MNHKVVDHNEWLTARIDLLAKEKDFTRRRDELSRARRELPWERVEHEYMFQTASGPQTLADLVRGRQSARRLSLDVRSRRRPGVQALLVLG